MLFLPPPPPPLLPHWVKDKTNADVHKIRCVIGPSPLSIIVFTNMLNSFTIMNYSENGYVFFILRSELLHLQNERETFMSHKTLSSHFLPHQISIERDYQKEFFRVFHSEINQKSRRGEKRRKIFCDDAFLWKYFSYIWCDSGTSENCDKRKLFAPQ